MARYVLDRPNRVAQTAWIFLCLNAGVVAQIVANAHGS